MKSLVSLLAAIKKMPSWAQAIILCALLLYANNKFLRDADAAPPVETRVVTLETEVRNLKESVNRIEGKIDILIARPGR